MIAHIFNAPKYLSTEYDYGPTVSLCGGGLLLDELYRRPFEEGDMIDLCATCMKLYPRHVRRGGGTWK